MGPWYPRIPNANFTGRLPAGNSTGNSSGNSTWRPPQNATVRSNTLSSKFDGFHINFAQSSFENITLPPELVSNTDPSKYSIKLEENVFYLRQLFAGNNASGSSNSSSSSSSHQPHEFVYFIDKDVNLKQSLKRAITPAQAASWDRTLIYQKDGKVYIAEDKTALINNYTDIVVEAS